MKLEQQKSFSFTDIILAPPNKLTFIGPNLVLTDKLEGDRLEGFNAKFISWEGKHDYKTNRIEGILEIE